MSSIIIEIKNNVGVIKINRPDVYNALNRESKASLVEAIKKLNKESAVSAIILTGEGKAFCSGQDLSDPGVTSGSDFGKILLEEWNPLVMSIKKSEKIVIGSLNGVCAGAGLSIALACDLKVSIPDNRLISGFAQIGLIPDAGSDHLLVKGLGYSKALEYSLFGKPISSAEALSFGLINEIHPSPLERSLEIASQIATLAPLSVKLIKKNLQHAEEHSFEEVIERETYLQRFMGFSGDYKEGVAAFKEKRKPNFSGK